MLLWENVQASCPKSAEVIKDVIGCCMKTPCVTRWNSLYDCLTLLLKHRSKLNDLMSHLELPIFKSQEYCGCLGPVACAIDRLQGEKGCYYGHLLSTLLTVQNKLNAVESNVLKYCNPLFAATDQCFKKRFSQYLSLDASINDAIAATA